MSLSTEPLSIISGSVETDDFVNSSDLPPRERFQPDNSTTLNERISEFQVDNHLRETPHSLDLGRQDEPEIDLTNIIQSGFKVDLQKSQLESLSSNNSFDLWEESIERTNPSSKVDFMFTWTPQPSFQ